MLGLLHDPEMNRWFIRKSTPGALRRLYCFPYAGGGINTFLSWQACLGNAIEICATQMPGRGARFLEPPCVSLEVLVNELAHLIAHEADRPFSLYGHSLGALVAFEIARYLRAHDLPSPENLIVSGCEAPHIRLRPKRFEEYDDAELIQTLKELNGTPTEVLCNNELMQMILPVTRADFTLSSNYQYQHSAPLNIPITVLSGTEDNHVEKDKINDWQSLTSNLCNVYWLEGDHFFIEQNQALLIQYLKPILLGSSTQS